MTDEYPVYPHGLGYRCALDDADIPEGATVLCNNAPKTGKLLGVKALGGDYDSDGDPIVVHQCGTNVEVHVYDTPDDPTLNGLVNLDVGTGGTNG